MTTNIDIASFAVEEALKNGASDADAIVVESADTSLRTRLGNFENIERSESKDLGIRVFLREGKGYRASVISTNNLQKSNVSDTVKRAIDTARMSPVDEHLRLAEKGEYAEKVDDLQIYDGTEVSNEEMLAWAKEAEDTAMSVKGITNSEGADAAYSFSDTVLVTSKGFSANYLSSGYTVSVSVIAGKDTAMETDYEYSYVRNKKDLDRPSDIGRKAGELTVKKLNPRKINTCKVPIVFDPRVSKGLLSSLCSAINGASIAKKSSFLTDYMDKQIFPENISIIDDATILKGLSSEPFDSEGVEGKKLFLVENGVLKSWILDLRSASKLGLKTTAHASRSVSGHPSPSSSNVYMTPGKRTPQQIISEIKEGLYLTDAFGMGVNGVTGDYSQGASGFWIENGEIAFPVSEITVAGSMLEMFRTMEAANDLVMRYSKNAPTIRIDGMTIAGV